MGLGFARYSNEAAYAAVVVEVEAGATIKVVRAVAAVDCGRTINPDGVSNQVEGGIVQAVSWVLKEQVRFDRTRITTRTWDDYPILRFSEAPPVEVIHHRPAGRAFARRRRGGSRSGRGGDRQRGVRRDRRARARSAIDARANVGGDQRRMTGG